MVRPPGPTQRRAPGEGTVITLLVVGGILGCCKLYQRGEERDQAAELLKQQQELVRKKEKEFRNACDWRGASAFTTTKPWICVSNATGQPVKLIPDGVEP